MKRGLLLMLQMLLSGMLLAQSATDYLALAAENRDNDMYADYLLSADSVARFRGDAQSEAVANQKLGQYYYTRNPDKAIEHFLKAYPLMLQLGDYNNAIFCLQNIGFTYEEKKNDLANAEKYIALTITARKDRKDTLQLANMYKYLGYLQGKAGKYAEAKENVNMGIALFSSKHYHQGVAVCYYDMGKVYEYEKRADSALYYYQKSKDIWLELGNDNKRLFNVNNALMNVNILKGNLGTAAKLFSENEEIMKKEFIYWSDKLNYYKYSADLFTKKNNRKQADQFGTQYLHTRDSLQRAGVWLNE